MNKPELKICLTTGLKTGNAKWKLDSLTRGFETHSREDELYTQQALSGRASRCGTTNIFPNAKCWYYWTQDGLSTLNES